MTLSPLIISMKVALPATFITFLCGIVAARLVLRLNRGQKLLDGIFTLPLVLPPTVAGFFLLLIFGKNSWLGQLLAGLGIQVVFTVTGAIIAAAVVSFPLMYRTARGAFEQVDENLPAAARTMGLSERYIFWRILLPLSWPGIAAGAILAFARAMGEFGATMMLAGNIPGRTQTMSIAVYTAMLSNDRALAYRWVAVIMLISLFTIMLMNYWNDYQLRLKRGKQKWRLAGGRENYAGSSDKETL